MPEKRAGSVLSRYTHKYSVLDIGEQHNRLFVALQIWLGRNVSDADSTHSSFSADNHDVPYQYRIKMASWVLNGYGEDF